MDKAAAEEKARRVAAAADAARKRGASATPAEAPAEKRPKLEHGTAGTGSAASFLATFDFTSLPASMVTDFIVANLQALPEEALADLVQAYRRTGPAGARPTAIAPTLTPALAAPASVATLPPASISLSTPIQAPTPTGPQTVTARQSDSPVPQKVDEVKDEPVDPLAMNIDTEELEYEPDKLNEEVSVMFTYYLHRSHYIVVAFRQGAGRGGGRTGPRSARAPAARVQVARSEGAGGN